MLTVGFPKGARDILTRIYWRDRYLGIQYDSSRPALFGPRQLCSLHPCWLPAYSTTVLPITDLKYRGTTMVVFVWQRQLHQLSHFFKPGRRQGEFAPAAVSIAFDLETTSIPSEAHGTFEPSSRSLYVMVCDGWLLGRSSSSSPRCGLLGFWKP